MINISEEAKATFWDSAVKNLFSVHFPNGEHRDLENSDIVAESLTFQENLCQQNNLKFGLCEANRISFKTIGVEQNLKGAEIECALSTVKYSEDEKESVTITKTIKGEGGVFNVVFEPYIYSGTFKIDFGQTVNFSCAFRGKNAKPTFPSFDYMSMTGGYGDSTQADINMAVLDLTITFTGSYKPDEITYTLKAIKPKNLGATIPLGRFTIDSCKRDTKTGTRSVEAYSSNIAYKTEASEFELLKRTLPALKPSYKSDPLNIIMQELNMPIKDSIIMDRTYFLNTHSRSGYYYDGEDRKTATLYYGTISAGDLSSYPFRLNGTISADAEEIKTKYGFGEINVIPYIPVEHQTTAWNSSHSQGVGSTLYPTNPKYKYWENRINLIIEPNKIYDLTNLPPFYNGDGNHNRKTDYMYIYLYIDDAEGVRHSLFDLNEIQLIDHNVQNVPQITYNLNVKKTGTYQYANYAGTGYLTENLTSYYLSNPSNSDLWKQTIDALELMGLFIKDTRDNELELVSLNDYLTKIYPDEDVYPSLMLFPSEGSEHIFGSEYYDCETEEDVTVSIGAVQFDYTASVDDNTFEATGKLVFDEDASDVYYIKDNKILKNSVWTEESIIELLQATFVPNVQGIKWIPLTVDMIGKPWIEVGDMITVAGSNENYQTYVFSRTLKGIQALNDSIESDVLMEEM